MGQIVFKIFYSLKNEAAFLSESGFAKHPITNFYLTI